VSFKAQLATDLANIMAAGEISEAVTHTPRTGAAVTGNAVVVVVGESDSEWNGGNVIVATAVLAKATFAKPQSHETIATSSTTWYVDSIIGESPVSWTVKMFSEQKPR
jgi:hypothetical protein